MIYIYVSLVIVLIFVNILLKDDVNKVHVIIRKISQIALSVVAFLILRKLGNIKLDIFEVDDISGLQFNIITVNSIIAGFLFTSLGIIISSSEKKIIKDLYNISILDNIMYNLTIGIGSSLLSIVMAILVLFVKFLEDIEHIIYLVQINLVVISIVFFCLAFLDTIFILKAIKPKEDPLKQARIDSTIEKIVKDNKNKKSKWSVLKK